MPKIIFLDTYYPDVLADMPPAVTYKQRTEQLRDLWFGTADFYSHEFSKMGWSALDIVANDDKGRNLWMKEMRHDKKDLVAAALQQICDEQPDVLYCQDLGFLPVRELRRLKSEGFVKILAAQHSCPWAGDEQVGAFDIVFTSFPHYIDRIKKLGVKSEFLAIAFGGQRVLDFLNTRRKTSGSWESRSLKVSFVGGVGGGATPGHWDAGTKLLMKVAEDFTNEFQWWGYGEKNVPKTHPLRLCYKGLAWGVDMYQAYARSKMVVNRHGEVADGYSNNMRMFEATGCGALLFTEESKNIKYYFEPGKECVTYSTPADLLLQIDYYLHHDAEARAIAEAGQKRTMAEHTYEKRLEYPEYAFREMKNLK